MWKATAGLSRRGVAPHEGVCALAAALTAATHARAHTQHAARRPPPAARRAATGPHVRREGTGDVPDVEVDGRVLDDLGLRLVAGDVGVASGAGCGQGDEARAHQAGAHGGKHGGGEWWFLHTVMRDTWCWWGRSGMDVAVCPTTGAVRKPNASEQTQGRPSRTRTFRRPVPITQPRPFGGHMSNAVVASVGSKREWDASFITHCVLIGFQVVSPLHAQGRPPWTRTAYPALTSLMRVQHAGARHRRPAPHRQEAQPRPAHRANVCVHPAGSRA